MSGFGLEDDGAPAALPDASARDSVASATVNFAPDDDQVQTSHSVHFNLDDDEVEANDEEEDLVENDMDDMYDFTGFIPGRRNTAPAEMLSLPADGSASDEEHSAEEERLAAAEKTRRRAEQREEMTRLEVSEAAMRERAGTLEEQMEVQERKLKAASKQVLKTRTEVKKLTAQVGLQDLQGSKNTKEVAQLRQLLVEREEQLQDALDDCDAAMLRAGDASDEDLEEEVALDAAPVAMSEENEESLIQLMRITEELTDALEAARAGEDDAKRQLAIASAELQREATQTEESRLRVLAAREAREAEVAALLARIKEQEQCLSAERERSRALQAGSAAKARDAEPEGEPAVEEAWEPLSKVDISDPEVAAAEKAARAALEAMRLHGNRSAAKAGAEASKVAGHLSHVANGGLLRNILQMRRIFSSPSDQCQQPLPAQEAEAAPTQDTRTPHKPLDWNYDMIEV